MIVKCPKCQKIINSNKTENIYCTDCMIWINYNYSHLDSVQTKNDEFICNLIKPYQKILTVDILNLAENILKNYKKLNEEAKKRYFYQIMKTIMNDLIHSTNFNEKIPYLYIRIFLKIQTDLKIIKIIENDYKENHNQKFTPINPTETIIYHNLIGFRKIYSRYNCQTHIYPLLVKYYQLLHLRNIDFNQYTLPALLFTTYVPIFDGNIASLPEIAKDFDLNESTFRRNIQKIQIISDIQKKIHKKFLDYLLKINILKNNEEFKDEIEEEDDILKLII